MSHGILRAGLVLVCNLQVLTGASWLDGPLTNWNKQGAGIPSPPTTPGLPPVTGRCREQVRKPATAPEKAIADLGWLYGPAYSDRGATILLGMASADGMCRPMSFQAFAFSGDRFAGTLSPIPMDSRSDGSLTVVHLATPGPVEAEFARYNSSDPLCCPSRISKVHYRLGGTPAPVLTPLRVSTEATSQADVSNDSEKNEALLSLVQWTLTEIEGRPWSAPEPNLTFDSKNHRISGNTGCNRFFGVYEINGDSIRISKIGATRRACFTPEGNQIEQQFLKALGSVTRFEAGKQSLRLFSQDRRVLVFSGS